MYLASSAAKAVLLLEIVEQQLSMCLTYTKLQSFFLELWKEIKDSDSVMSSASIRAGFCLSNNP